MHLTDAEQEEGRGGFYRAITGAQALEELAGGKERGPRRGGGQGRAHRGGEPSAASRQRPPTAWWLAYRHEIAGFCAAIREGAPLRCGPEKALGSAAACIQAEEAGFQRTRLALSIGGPSGGHGASAATKTIASP